MCLPVIMKGMRDGWAGWCQKRTSAREQEAAQEPGWLADPGACGVIDLVLQRASLGLNYEY
jgi:hypothetical protein